MTSIMVFVHRLGAGWCILMGSRLGEPSLSRFHAAGSTQKKACADGGATTAMIVIFVGLEEEILGDPERDNTPQGTAA